MTRGKKNWKLLIRFKVPIGKTDDTPPYWASKPNKLTNRRNNNSRPYEPFLNQDVPVEGLSPFFRTQDLQGVSAGLLAQPTQPLKKLTFSIVAHVLQGMHGPLLQDRVKIPQKRYVTPHQHPLRFDLQQKKWEIKTMKKIPMSCFLL